jgi:hypothetical protein
MGVSTGGWRVCEPPDISNLEAGLAAEDLVANDRVTGEVLEAVEQSSNNDKGDVENAILFMSLKN